MYGSESKQNVAIGGSLMMGGELAPVSYFAMFHTPYRGNSVPDVVHNRETRGGPR